jgi:hypothetical protein
MRSFAAAAAATSTAPPPQFANLPTPPPVPVNMQRAEIDKGKGKGKGKEKPAIEVRVADPAGHGFIRGHDGAFHPPLLLSNAGHDEAMILKGFRTVPNSWGNHYSKFCPFYKYNDLELDHMINVQKSVAAYKPEEFERWVLAPLVTGNLRGVPFNRSNMDANRTEHWYYLTHYGQPVFTTTFCAFVSHDGERCNRPDCSFAHTIRGQADAVQLLMDWADKNPLRAAALIAVYKPLVVNINRNRASREEAGIPSSIMLGPGQNGSIEYRDYRRQDNTPAVDDNKGATGKGVVEAYKGAMGKGTVDAGKGTMNKGPPLVGGVNIIYGKGTSAARSRTPHTSSRVRDVREVDKMAAAAAADPIRAADQAAIDQRTIVNLSNLDAQPMDISSITVPPPPAGQASGDSHPPPPPPVLEQSVTAVDEPMHEGVPPESEDLPMTAPCNVDDSVPSVSEITEPPIIGQDVGMTPYVDLDDDKLPDFDEDENNPEPGNVVEGQAESVPVPEDPPGLDPADNDDAEIPAPGDVVV